MVLVLFKIRAGTDEDAPLTIAAASGRTEVVRVLLAARAEVNAQESDGRTALMAAAANRRLKVLEARLEAKGGLNAQQRDGSTAVTLALTNHHPEVAVLLTRATVPRESGSATL